MPSNITESDLWEAAVSGPDDLDALNALSVRNGLQDLANRTRFLRSSLIEVATFQFSGTIDTSYSGSSFVNIVQGGTDWKLEFTDLEAGDMLVMMATSVTIDTITGGSSGTFRWGDGAAASSSDGTLTLGASSMGSMVGWDSIDVPSSGASFDRYLQVNPNGATDLNIDTPMFMVGLHFRSQIP